MDPFAYSNEDLESAKSFEIQQEDISNYLNTPKEIVVDNIDCQNQQQTNQMTLKQEEVQDKSSADQIETDKQSQQNLQEQTKNLHEDSQGLYEDLYIRFQALEEASKQNLNEKDIEIGKLKIELNRLQADNSKKSKSLVQLLSAYTELKREYDKTRLALEAEQKSRKIREQKEKINKIDDDSLQSYLKINENYKNTRCHTDTNEKQQSDSNNTRCNTEISSLRCSTETKNHNRFFNIDSSNTRQSTDTYERNTSSTQLSQGQEIKERQINNFVIGSSEKMKVKVDRNNDKILLKQQQQQRFSEQFPRQQQPSSVKASSNTSSSNYDQFFRNVNEGKVRNFQELNNPINSVDVNQIGSNVCWNSQDIKIRSSNNLRNQLEGNNFKKRDFSNHVEGFKERSSVDTVNGPFYAFTSDLKISQEMPNIGIRQIDSRKLDHPGNNKKEEFGYGDLNRDDQERHGFRNIQENSQKPRTDMNGPQDIYLSREFHEDKGSRSNSKECKRRNSKWNNQNEEQHQQWNNEYICCKRRESKDRDNTINGTCSCQSCSQIQIVSSRKQSTQMNSNFKLTASTLHKPTHMRERSAEYFNGTKQIEDDLICSEQGIAFNPLQQLSIYSAINNVNPMHFKKTQDPNEKRVVPLSQFENQTPGIPQQPSTAGAAVQFQTLLGGAGGAQAKISEGFNRLLSRSFCKIYSGDGKTKDSASGFLIPLEQCQTAEKQLKYEQGMKGDVTEFDSSPEPKGKLTLFDNFSQQYHNQTRNHMMTSNNQQLQQQQYPNGAVPIRGTNSSINNVNNNNGQSQNFNLGSPNSNANNTSLGIGNVHSSHNIEGSSTGINISKKNTNLIGNSNNNYPNQYSSQTCLNQHNPQHLPQNMQNLNQSIKGLLGTEVFFRDNEAVAKAKLSAQRHLHSGANRNLTGISNDRNNKLIVSMNMQNNSNMASNNNNTLSSYSNEVNTPHASQTKIQFLQQQNSQSYLRKSENLPQTSSSVQIGPFPNQASNNLNAHQIRQISNPSSGQQYQQQIQQLIPNAVSQQQLNPTTHSSKQQSQYVQQQSASTNSNSTSSKNTNLPTNNSNNFSNYLPNEIIPNVQSHKSNHHSTKPSFCSFQEYILAGNLPSNNQGPTSPQVNYSTKSQNQIAIQKRLASGDNKSSKALQNTSKQQHHQQHQQQTHLHVSTSNNQENIFDVTRSSTENYKLNNYSNSSTKNRKKPQQVWTNISTAVSQNPNSSCFFAPHISKDIYSPKQRFNTYEN